MLSSAEDVGVRDTVLVRELVWHRDVEVVLERLPLVELEAEA